MSYETWLAAHTPVIARALERKHDKMASSAFVFMRATFYRWAQTFRDHGDAPLVLAVGDLHVNNFGLWRDAEGRLAWGVNDFDEAHPLPYTNDLVRLALSAGLTAEEAELDVCLRHACEAILSGYAAGLRKGGRAYVLAERNDWIRDLALERLVHPDRFWAKLERLPSADGDAPAEAVAALEAMLPEPGIPYRLAARTAGVGSLGRPRYVTIAEWAGGRIAREAKAIVPSACVWSGDGADTGHHYEHFFAHSVRARDPWVAAHGDWIVRRLAPDCTRIELHSLPNSEKAQRKLLKAMGRETANVHLATEDCAEAILRDLEARDHGWLRDAARTMLKAVRRDWRDWRAQHTR